MHNRVMNNLSGIHCPGLGYHGQPVAGRQEDGQDLPGLDGSQDRHEKCRLYCDDGYIFG